MGDGTQNNDTNRGMKDRLLLYSIVIEPREDKSWSDLKISAFT